jgi:uncharacterized protein HemX
MKDATTAIGLAVAFAVLGYLNIQDFHRYEQHRAAGEQRATEERKAAALKKSMQDAQHRIEELKRELERLQREYGSPEIRPRLIENG